MGESGASERRRGDASSEGDDGEEGVMKGGRGGEEKGQRT